MLSAPLPSAYGPLPTVNCALPMDSCLSPTAACLTPTDTCVLPICPYFLPTAPSLLPSIERLMLADVCCQQRSDSCMTACSMRGLMGGSAVSVRTNWNSWCRRQSSSWSSSCSRSWSSSWNSRSCHLSGCGSAACFWRCARRQEVRVGVEPLLSIPDLPTDASCKFATDRKDVVGKDVGETDASCKFATDHRDVVRKMWVTCMSDCIETTTSCRNKPVS